jgi:hypothetical protein
VDPGLEAVSRHGPCDRVSLTGAVAFEKVAKVRRRQVQLDPDPIERVRTNTCQTVRMTIRAEMEESGGKPSEPWSALMIW